MGNVVDLNAVAQIAQGFRLVQATVAIGRTTAAADEGKHPDRAIVRRLHLHWSRQASFAHPHQQEMLKGAAILPQFHRQGRVAVGLQIKFAVKVGIGIQPLRHSHFKEMFDRAVEVLGRQSRFHLGIGFQVVAGFEEGAGVAPFRRPVGHKVGKGLAIGGIGQTVRHIRLGFQIVGRIKQPQEGVGLAQVQAGQLSLNGLIDRRLLGCRIGGDRQFRGNLRQGHQRARKQLRIKVIGRWRPQFVFQLDPKIPQGPKLAAANDV